MTIQSQKIKGDDFTHLYFPLAKLGKNKSIFADSDKKIFADKYKSVMESIIGKQLALNTYYANDLIAAANTKITVDLLIIFDNLKINFKVNFNNITEEERNTALDLAMGEIIQSKKQFWEDMQTVKIPQIQTSVKSFISNSVSEQQLDFFDEYYSKLKSFVEMANNVITSEKKYEATAVAIKKTIDTEQKIFNLPENAIGETIEHVIKTTQIALLIAGELSEFDHKDCEMLSVISLSHDCGKALVPERIIYKKGRLTQLENDIMKSHVLLSFILASNNQNSLHFEPFVMALHHLKEDSSLPQSYGISKDTHTSFYEYLTPEAQVKLNEIYHLTKKYFRVISVADTFEAITSERVYKRASSMGKALAIMINDNKKNHFFYKPYLDQLIKFVLQKYLPKNRTFKLTDEVLDNHLSLIDLPPDKREKYKKESLGVIVKPCSTFDEKLECIIFQTNNKQIQHTINIPPAFFLNDIYFQ